MMLIEPCLVLISLNFEGLTDEKNHQLYVFHFSH